MGDGIDLSRIKRNVAKMASMGAPEADIDGYIASEGTTVDAIRAFKQPATQSEKAASISQPSMLESGIRGIGQGATLGYSDELMGMIGNLYARAVRPDLFEGQSLTETYRQGRDIAREQEAAAKEANPVSYIGGEVAGGLIPAAMMPAANLTKGAGAGGRIANAAATGAGYGAAYASGGSEADLTKGQYQQLAEDVGLGGALGGVTGGVLQGVMEAPRALGRLAGVNPQRVAELEQAGLPVNLPAASDSAPVKTLANVSSQLPGGKALQTSMDAAYQQADDVLRSLGYTGKTTPTGAGETVRSAFGRWQQAGRNRFKGVDAKLQQMVPDESMARLNNIAGSVDDVVAAPGLTPRQLQNRAQLPAVRELQGVIDDAAQNGGAVSLGALKEARTRVGRLLEQGAIKTQDDALADKVYSKLTDMMKDSIEQTGGKKAVKAFELRNKIYSKYIDENKNFVAKMQKKLGDTPEAIFNTMTSGDKKGAGQAARVMMKLNPVERDAMRDAIIFQKGGGDNFTIGKWMTQYGNMSREAKQAFFTGRPELRQAHDQLAKALENYKDVGKFGNPSRTGYVNTLMGLITGGSGLSVAAIAGIPAAISTGITAAAGGYGVNKALSEAMSSPRVVRWLARSISNPPKQVTNLPAAIRGAAPNVSRNVAIPAIGGAGYMGYQAIGTQQGQ